MAPSRVSQALAGWDPLGLGETMSAVHNIANYLFAPQADGPAPAPKAPAPTWGFGTPAAAAPAAAPQGQTGGIGGGGGVDPDFIVKLLKGQQQVESSGNGNAQSGAGAQGLGQVMPSTAAALAKNYGIKLDPALMKGTSPEAIHAQTLAQGAAFFDALKLAGGDPIKALTIYHGGTNPQNYGPLTAAYPGKVMGAAGLTTVGTPNSGDPYKLPDQTLIDPAALAGMYGPASHIAPVQLPNAPTLEANPAVPHAEEISKSILDQLAATAPKARDSSHDFRDKLITALAAAGQGLTAAAPGQGTLGGIAAGLSSAAVATKGERDHIQALNDANTEAQRAFAQKLAEAGIKVDESNVGTRNANLQADYQTGVNKVATGNQNATLDYDTRLKQVMANLGISEANTQADNALNMARGQAQVGAVGSNARTLNDGAQTQTGYNRQKNVDTAAGVEVSGGPGGNTAKTLERKAGTILAKAGIPIDEDPKEGLDIRVARETGRSVAAGNREGAVAGLGKSMIVDGSYASLQGLDPKTKKAIDQKVAAKDIDGAASLMSGVLNQNIQNVPDIAKHLGAMGNRTAQVIYQNIAPGA